MLWNPFGRKPDGQDLMPFRESDRGKIIRISNHLLFQRMAVAIWTLATAEISEYSLNA